MNEVGVVYAGWYNVPYTQRNLIKSNRNQIVFTIWNQKGIRLVPNLVGH